VAYKSAFDKKGPLRQTISIPYEIDEDLLDVFKAVVKVDFANMKKTVESGTPIDTGELVGNWNFKMKISDTKITVVIKNKSEYSNYIMAGGSTIFRGLPVLEEQMTKFELNVLTEISDLV